MPPPGKTISINLACDLFSIYIYRHVNILTFLNNNGITQYILFPVNK